MNYEKNNNFSGLALGSREQGDKVPCKAVDNLPLRYRHLIKVNVEGIENKVLISATEIVNRYWPILHIRTIAKPFERALNADF